MHRTERERLRYSINKDKINATRRKNYDPAKAKARRKAYSEARRKQMYDKRRRIKNILIEAFGGKCKDCGFVGTGYVMEFHHRDRATKEIDVCKCESLQRAMREAMKCDLLCCRCHRIKENAYNEFRRAFLDAVQAFPLPQLK